MGPQSGMLLGEPEICLADRLRSNVFSRAGVLVVGVNDAAVGDGMLDQEEEVSKAWKMNNCSELIQL